VGPHADTTSKHRKPNGSFTRPILTVLPLQEAHVAGPVIFRELPETFPEKNKYKKPSVVSSVIFHVVLILVLIAIPFLMPQSISKGELLVRLVAPLEPPPPPPPPAAKVAVAQPRPVKPVTKPVTPGALVTPTAIPKDVAKIIDEPNTPQTPALGGVPGGIPGSVAGGVLGGILSEKLDVSPAPPMAPPAPPPAPKAVAPVGPVRVGGIVKEPRVIKVVNPVYPRLARMANVSGTVVLEALVTTQGEVSEIKVISGHPLLIQAAIECVKQWRYEPTLLNGVPTPVILTAKISFQRTPIT
jgi:protein TonB